MSEIIKEPISGAMIDLFAGAGGLSCGLEQAGFHLCVLQALCYLC